MCAYEGENRASPTAGHRRAEEPSTGYAAPVSVLIAALALATSIYALVAGELRSRSDRKRRQAVGPAEEIREALTVLRTHFVDMISAGGWREPEFLQPERKHCGQRIEDLRKRVADGGLQRLMSDVVKAWNGAAASAPPLRALVAWAGSPPDPVEEEDQRGFERQEKAAEEGRAACDSALGRLNELDSE